MTRAAASTDTTTTAIDPTTDPKSSLYKQESNSTTAIGDGSTVERDVVSLDRPTRVPEQMQGGQDGVEIEEEGVGDSDEEGEDLAAYTASRAKRDNLMKQDAG